VAEKYIVDESNQDDMGRVLGYYVYADTEVWMENGKVSRRDGPAVITPDGIDRYYIDGKEITLDVRDFFAEHRWNPQKQLNKPEKLAAFQEKFCK